MQAGNGEYMGDAGNGQLRPRFVGDAALVADGQGPRHGCLLAGQCFVDAGADRLSHRSDESGQAGIAMGDDLERADRIGRSCRSRQNSCEIARHRLPGAAGPGTSASRILPVTLSPGAKSAPSRTNRRARRTRDRVAVQRLELRQDQPLTALGRVEHFVDPGLIGAEIGIGGALWCRKVRRAAAKARSPRQGRAPEMARGRYVAAKGLPRSRLLPPAPERLTAAGCGSVPTKR